MNSKEKRTKEEIIQMFETVAPVEILKNYYYVDILLHTYCEYNRLDILVNDPNNNTCIKISVLDILKEEEELYTRKIYVLSDYL